MGLKWDFLVFCPVVPTPPFQLSVSGDQALGMGVQPVFSVSFWALFDETWVYISPVYILCGHCRLLFRGLEIGCNYQTFLDSISQKHVLGLDIVGSGAAEFLNPNFVPKPNSHVSSVDNKPASVAVSIK